MTTVSSNTAITLPRNENQALGIGRFAVDFMDGKLGEPGTAALDRTLMFFTDSIVCGISAIAMGTNAPHVLRAEALTYAQAAGTPIFGSSARLAPEKAIVANCAAVREWDANGTNFGYNPDAGHTAGEFGHNDFYPVAIAAAQLAGRDGADALRGMLLLDEIRGRLAEVFSLKTYKIDHVVHGAIGSAAAYGAMLGATPAQIESAIGMVVAHYIPWRAIRAGRQLSDSKGASAAISTEAAVLAMQRSMRGFVGPADVFRNPEAIFRAFEGPGQLFVSVVGDGAVNDTTADASPFDLILTYSGDDFAVAGMHFKLGLYEHQSAGALQAVITLLERNPQLLSDPAGGQIERIKILAYEPAFGIIGDPAKRNPTTRQSADHSMTYIVATLLRKALEQRRAGWKELMLEPADYSPKAINNPLTRSLMQRIEFEHGGEEYDRRYPDGIPTSVVITTPDGATFDSGLVMYPGGHARNDQGQTPVDLHDALNHKFRLLAALVSADFDPILARYTDLRAKSAHDIQSINDLDLTIAGPFD